MAKLLWLILALLIMLSPGCGGAPGGTPPIRGNESFFSFEDDLHGWTANALDVDNPPLDWSIERSQELARDGTTSIKFYLPNYNDAGKLFIARAFPVNPNTSYKVQVRYAFASADSGDFNLFTIIAGVLPKPPQTGADLGSTFRDSTGNGSHSEPGFLWLDKNYTFSVQSDSNATLYVVIGVWGTYEVARTYYVDAVDVTIGET